MTDKAREEFEQWVMSTPMKGATPWDAWQASRAALVIELPEGFETYCGSTEERVIYADEMKDVLVAAGLKVAP